MGEYPFFGHVTSRITQKYSGTFLLSITVFIPREKLRPGEIKYLPCARFQEHDCYHGDCGCYDGAISTTQVDLYSYKDLAWRVFMSLGNLAWDFFCHLHTCT